MALPSWAVGLISAAGDVGAAILGGALGTRWADGKDLKGQVKDITKEQAKEVAEKITKHLVLDRESVLKALLLLRDEGLGIIHLLERAQLNGGAVAVGGKRYTEDWVVRMLQTIDPGDRPWVYAVMNSVLEKQGEVTFFAMLEVLHNNGWIQWLQRAAEIAGPQLRKLQPLLEGMNAASREVARSHDELNQRLRATNRRNRRRWL